MGENRIIGKALFEGVFHGLHRLDQDTCHVRWNALETAAREMGWQPSNVDEAAAFLAHVAHETNGLTTLREAGNENELRRKYQQNSWSDVQPCNDATYYYGRGWLQLSYPANYKLAGAAINRNNPNELWEHPEIVKNDEVIACKTAIWFWRSNGMGPLAANGHFGRTTAILNRSECTPGDVRQKTGVAHYRRVRQVLGCAPVADERSWYAYN